MAVSSFDDGISNGPWLRLKSLVSANSRVNLRQSDKRTLPMTLLLRIQPRLSQLCRRPCNRPSVHTVTSRFSFSEGRGPSTSEFERPSPPRLPKQLQEEFERLQKGAQHGSSGKRSAAGEELHPDVRPPPPAEFSGDRNPLTGEIGGPKTEPTKHGDWSYGGRTTDF